MSSTIRRLLVLGLAALMGLALAAPALAQNGQAQVRVAHLAGGAQRGPHVNGEPKPAPKRSLHYGLRVHALPRSAGTQQVTGMPAIPRHSGSSYAVDLTARRWHGGGGRAGGRRLAHRAGLPGRPEGPLGGHAKLRVVHASPDAGPVDVVPRGGSPLVEGLTFPLTPRPTPRCPPEPTRWT